MNLHRLNVPSSGFKTLYGSSLRIVRVLYESCLKSKLGGIEMDERMVEIVNNYGDRNQGMMLIEEMSELAKAICKIDRLTDGFEAIGVSDAMHKEANDNLREEIADVHIMLIQMQYIAGLSDTELNEIVNMKLDRQIERIRLINSYREMGGT